tara:strand:- start:227 stop:580 length:354 start_codon:yes stop_codon:yes gene_type:complete
MKITRKQLRRIIQEAVFGDKAPHPLLRDNQSGNGYSVTLFEPVYDWLEENHQESEETKLLHAIMTDKIKGLHYVPFVFGDKVMEKMRKLGAERDVIEMIQGNSMLEEYEYQIQGADY